MSSQGDNDFKPLYKSMKRKLKFLIYENECYQEELRKSQRTLLRVQRDKSFLLDRIMQYQQGPETSSDSEETDESDNESFPKDNKRRKTTEQNSTFSINLQGNSKNSGVKKKKSSSYSVAGSGSVIVTKNVNSARHVGKQLPGVQASLGNTSKMSTSHRSKGAALGHSASGNLGGNPHITGTTSTAPVSEVPMSREEIERQLAARQPITDFSTVSLTLPNQLFSDNLLDGELMDNDMETSPSNLGEDINFESFD